MTNYLIKLSFHRQVYVIFVWIVLIFLNSTAFAQNNNQVQSKPRKISGIVNIDRDEPIVGAIIRNVSTPTSTVSNTKGEFQIDAGIGDVLEVVFMGFRTERITIENFSLLNVRLTQLHRELDEVVVVAYGEMKREELTGAVGNVKMDDLRKAPVADIKQALAGRIAGVEVNSNDGQPGSTVNITIRGGNSLTQSNAPLYVVDGFPITDFDTGSINAEDIASITILKDADATSVYGSRAANGVVVIETKRGSSGAPVVSYHGYAGVQNLMKKMEMMDSYEYVDYMIDRRPLTMTAKYLTQPGLTLEDYRDEFTADWQELLFEAAYMQSHHLSIRGGDAKTKYTASASLFDQDGLVPNSGWKRYQGRMSLEQAVGQKLKFNINANFSNFGNHGIVASNQAGSGPGGNAASTYLLFQTWGARPLIGANEDIYNSLFTEGADDPDGGGLFNPIVSSRNTIRQQTTNHLLVNAKIDYTILNGLTFTSRGGVNTVGTRNESFYNSKTIQGYPFINNIRGAHGNFNEVQGVNWSSENLLNFNRMIKKGHRVGALLGVSMQSNAYNNYGFGVNNVVREDMGVASLQFGEPMGVTATRTRNVLASYFTKANYNINAKYFFSGSFRMDGSSRFSSNNRWGYFPSGGFSWLMGKENFMKKIKLVSDAKLRLSYGATGNNGVGNFAQYSTVNIIGNYYSFNNEIPIPGTTFSNLRDPNLKWETTLQSNIGLDLSLFNGKVSLVTDLYRKTTKDLLLSADLPGATGFTVMQRNIGRVNNDGLEFSLTTKNIMKRDFSWESTFNISFNRNRVKELAFGQNMLLSRVNWVNAYNLSNLYVAQVGQSASNFYGYIWEGNYQYSDFNQNQDGSWTLKSSVPTNGAGRASIRPGDIKYSDLNGDGVVNENDMTIIGRAFPIHNGGFSNSFRYKQFDLHVFFQWNYGNDIFNASRMAFEGNIWDRDVNQFATYVNRWTEENQNDTYYRAGGSGPLGMYSSRTLEDGSYLRLKTAQLSYTIPKTVLKRLKVKNISTYLSGQDLLTWTNYSGMDPEVSVRNTFLTPGFDWSAYPRARTVTFGVRVEL